MQYCTNCNSEVSEQFARVLGDNDDEIHACPACSAKTRVARTSRDRSVARRDADSAGTQLPSGLEI